MAQGGAAVIRLIIAELSRADDQRHDWYAWVTNQLAHGVVGMAAAAALLASGMAPCAVPVWAALVYWTVWECAWQGGRDPDDSLSDASHVAAGSLFAAALAAAGPAAAMVMLVPWGLLLAIGIIRRCA